MIFTIRIQRFALLLRKNRSTDLHRFLPYGISFLDMKTREHDFFSRRLLFLTERTENTEFYLSPTDGTNFTSLFSLKRLFLPQIAQITRIHFFFFLDMKTREHDFSHGDYYFSRNYFSLTELTECTETPWLRWRAIRI